MKKLSILIVLVLAACSEKQLTDNDFKAALDRGLEKSNQACVGLNKAFPAIVNRMEQQYGVGRELAALERVGLMTSSDTGNGKRYDITEAGKKFFIEKEGKSLGMTVEKKRLSYVCLGNMRTDKVIKWDAPVNKNDFVVTYTYRLENMPEWANSSSLIQAMPKVAVLVNGAQKTEKRQVVKLTANGLEAIDNGGS